MSSFARCNDRNCSDKDSCKSCLEAYQNGARKPEHKPNPAHNACRTCGEQCTEHWYGNCWECANRYDVEQEAEPHKVGQMLLLDELIDRLIKARVKFKDFSQVRIINEDYSWGPGEVTLLEDDPNGSYADMNCVFVELVNFGGDPLPSTWPDPTYGNLLIEREEAEEMFLAVGEGEDISQEEYDELEAAYEKAIDAVELYLATKKS